MKYAILTVLLASMLLSGCTNAEQARFGSYGDDFKITVYSGGKVVKEYISDGKIETGQGGIAFFYSSDGKYIQVSGDYVVERINE